MISFKNFITENTKLISDLEAEVDDYLAKKEIVKPRYEELKRKIDNALRKEFEVAVTIAHRRGKGSSFDDHPEDAMRDLFWATVDSANGVLTLKNKLAKVKDKQNDVYKAFEQFYRTYEPISQRLKDLKQYVVTTAKKREEAKQAKAIVQAKRFADASSLVKTLTSFIDQYVKEAEHRAAVFHDDIMKKIREAGGVDAIAPKVDYHKVGFEEYKRAEDKRKFYISMTKIDKDQYVKQASQGAHDDYMAWVHKMTEKIGKPVVDSKMTGNPWKGSTIHVTTDDGEKQTWITTMIINQSKYGKLFNQFPSRKK